MAEIKNQTSGNSNLFKIIVISIGHLCHDIYTSFLSPILPLIIKKFELSYASAGFLSVLLRLPSLLNPFIGAYADRVNLRVIVVISPTVTAVAMCLIGSAPSYMLIAVLILITGVSSSCFHVPTPVLLKQLAGRRVGTAMSSFQIGGELARTIGPLVVLGAVAIWTLEGIYRLIPLGLLMSLVFYKILKDVPEKQVQPRHNIGGSILATFKSEKALYVCVSGILLSKSFSATMLAAFLPTYLTETGESLWYSGAALSILQAAAIVGVLLSGTLSDKIGCKKVLIILTAAAPLSMIFFLHAKGVLFIISLILLGISSFSSTPVILAMIQKRDFEFPSIANGLYMTINFMLSSAMILLAGILSDAMGIMPTFALFAVCSFIGLPFAYFLKDGRTKE